MHLCKENSSAATADTTPNGLSWVFSPLFFLILYCSSLFLPFSDVPSCPSHAYLSLLTRQSLSLLCNNIFKNCKLVRSFRIELSRYYPVHIFITAINYFFRLTLSVGNDFADFKILVFCVHLCLMSQKQIY